ncbi:hypothetical protein QF042_004949 [Pedobacter sp. W3I1]|nr:hypothetical protein [Pedobacter sp. W3I1]
MVAFFVEHNRGCHSERSEESLVNGGSLMPNFCTAKRSMHSSTACATQQQILHCVQNDSYLLCIKIFPIFVIINIIFS